MEFNGTIGKSMESNCKLFIADKAILNNGMTFREWTRNPRL